MTLINDLIRRARAEPPPAELTINDSQVSSVAEHCRSLMFLLSDEKENIEVTIRAGKLKFMDIPVRVIGVRNEQEAGELPPR